MPSLSDEICEFIHLCEKWISLLHGSRSSLGGMNIAVLICRVSWMSEGRGGAVVAHWGPRPCRAEQEGGLVAAVLHPPPPTTQPQSGSLTTAQSRAGQRD